MTIINRKTARGQLGTLLSAALVGTGKPAQAVYSYKVSDFQGASPVVVVSSEGADRTQATQQLRNNTHFYYNIFVFVLYKDEVSSWTEQNAEDKIDDIEQLIAGVIVDNCYLSGYWNDLSKNGPSTTDIIEVGGVQYIRESIPVVAQVMDN